MKHNAKKAGIACAFSLALVMSTAHAAQGSESAQLRNLDNRVTALEQKKGMTSLINPAAGPRVRNGADVFINADLFYWKAQENGVPVGIISVAGPSYVNSTGQVVTSSAANSVNLEHRWDLGFRIGLGYNLPHDGWDVSLTWLRFKTRGQAGTAFDTSPSTSIYGSQSTYPLDSGQNIVNQAYGRYRLLLNQLDLELGRNFFVSKWLAVRPHVGLRTDWIPQRQTLDYRFLSSGNLNYEHSYDKLKYWGLGLCGGLDTQWGLGSGFSIYGNGSFSILYGFFKDTHYGKINLPVNFYTSYSSYSFQHVSRAIGDLELGFRFDHMFLDDQFHLQIQAGWEQHIYFGLNQFGVSAYSATGGELGKGWLNQGDLTMQGWTLSVRVDF